MPESQLMSRNDARRILLVGSARSGTSWTGRALGCAEATAYVNEPDNVDANPAPGARTGVRGLGPFPVIAPGEESPGFEALWALAFSARVPNRKGIRRGVSRLALRLPRAVRDPLMRRVARVVASAPGAPEHTVAKSVMAHFSLQWIWERFHPRVVIIQRNPLNVVSSWITLNVHGFDIHRRAAILERFAEPIGIRSPGPDASPLSLTAWWVGLLNVTLARAAAVHPEWIVISHESLCDETELAFHDLYARLGLTWTARSDKFLAEYGYHRPTFRPSYAPGEGLTAREITRAQTQRWRERLSDDQVREIESVLEAFPTRGWVRPPTL
jgi:Sulfotransferase family